MAAVFAHRRHFLNRVHRHQEQDHRDNRAAQGFNHAQNAWVQGGYRPGGHQHEQCSDFVQTVDFNGLAFTTQRFNHHAVEAFTCAQVVAQEGFGDGDNRDDRRHPRNQRCVKVVCQVRQNRDVLLFRRRQIRRGEAQHAAEHEEHYGQYHHDVRASQDAGALLLCAIAVLFTLRYCEGRDDWRVVEGEYHHRDRQPQGQQQTVAGRGCAAQRQGFQRSAVPLWDQVTGQHHQSRNKREHQHAHRFHNHLLAEAHDGHHTDDQDQGQNRTRRRGHLKLVHHKAFNGVGDSNAVHQQNRVNREEVEQGNQLTCADAEVFFNDFSDVFARIFTGQHEAGQAAVCKEGHRESDEGHDDQRDHTADTCVDRKEQYTSADCCAVQAKHPHGIRFAPTASGFNRSNGAGLSGFHLYLLEEANCQVFSQIR